MRPVMMTKLSLNCMTTDLLHTMNLACTKISYCIILYRSNWISNFIIKVNNICVSNIKEVKKALTKPIIKKNKTYFIFENSQNKIFTIELKDMLAQDVKLSSIYSFKLSWPPSLLPCWHQQRSMQVVHFTINHRPNRDSKETSHYSNPRLPSRRKIAKPPSEGGSWVGPRTWHNKQWVRHRGCKHTNLVCVRHASWSH